jgi:hypothetical protein
MSEIPIESYKHFHIFPLQVAGGLAGYVYRPANLNAAAGYP